MKVGESCVYHGSGENDLYNNTITHPAIVTRVHSDTMVNLKVFFDCGPVEDRTSVAAQHSPHRGIGSAYFAPVGL